MRGYVAVTTALLLLAMLGFVALSVDIGMLYSARVQAQSAADAGALAGAFTFVTAPNAPQPDRARTVATAVAGSNKILGAQVVVAPAGVAVDAANHRVMVVVTKVQPTFFARALGLRSVVIGAKATAEALGNGAGTGCLKPWFLSNAVAANLAGLTDPCQACAQGRVLISRSANGDYVVTDWGRSLITDERNQLILVALNPSERLKPGNFYEVDSGSPGHYQEDIAGCFITAFVHQSYSVLTGSRIGASDSGTEELIGCPAPDLYLSVGRYRRADGTIAETSRSLVAAPIWDSCNVPQFCPAGRFPVGRVPTLEIIGFAMLFVEGLQYDGGGVIGCEGSNPVVRLINLAPARAVSLHVTGPYGFPVRLVR